jgi:hypothetical protein
MTGAAVTLGLSSLALAAFPLVRPFFPFDPTTPTETLAGASRAVTSPQWLVAHYLALIGFVLLLCALAALHNRLAPAGAPVRPAAERSGRSPDFAHTRRGTLRSARYCPPLPGQPGGSIARRVHLSWRRDARHGPGLLLLAVGAIMLATAIARSRSLPTWAGITFAVGLALWCPLLPPAARVADGLLIGIGGVGLAWALRRAA